jgi:hypothetical protein
VLFITLQEFIRVSAFSILAVHIYSTTSTPPNSIRAFSFSAEFHPVNDPSFLEVWLLGLGWAVAEVCASIAQGYDLLSTYEDMFAPQRTDFETSNGIGLVDRYRDGELDSLAGEIDEDVALVMNGASNGSMIDDATADLDAAVMRIVNAKARDDLEAVYGVPFIVSPFLLRLAISHSDPLRRISPSLCTSSTRSTRSFSRLASR